MSYTHADVELAADAMAADLGLEAWQVRSAARAVLSALAAAGRDHAAGVAAGRRQAATLESIVREAACVTVRAALDERERKAKEGLLGFPIEGLPVTIPDVEWVASYHEVVQRPTGRVGKPHERSIVADCGPANVYPAKHIAANDPAAVLRLVASLREIVDAYAAQLAWAAKYYSDDQYNGGLCAGLEKAVRALAHGLGINPEED